MNRFRNLSAVEEAIIKDIELSQQKAKKFSADYIHLENHMWVNIKTHEKVFIDDDLEVHHLDALIGQNVYLSEEQVEELCAREDRVDNYLEY